MLRNIAVGNSRILNSYFQELSKKKHLNKKEELTLWEKYQKTHDINTRNQLVEANLKFVASIASHYCGRGLSFEELIAEGNIGLIRALNRYDGSKGYKIISYSVWWIRQAIQEALEKRSLIDGEDLVENINNDIEDDDFINFKESVPEQYIYENEETDNNYDTKAILESLISILNEREKLIIINYFGLNNLKNLTLEEIGKELNITKERVRQIMEKAIKKMRNEMILKYDFQTI